MTERQHAAFLIDRYMDLLRVKKAGNEAWENEIDNQICQTKAQLEALGIVVENLRIK